MSVITVERKVLERNDAVAQENRAAFKAAGAFVVNLLSSPGSGKTSLLEQTIVRLKDRVAVAVIEGDVQTDLDARRIEALGVPATQIVTNGGCHLDARLIKQAIPTLDLRDRLVLIENVGNLVCPAGYDLGEDLKTVVISVTEGDDKPLKYPATFRNAGACVINKIDLLPYVNCRVDTLIANARAVNSRLRFFQTSCTTGAGIDEWCEWLVGGGEAA